MNGVILKVGNNHFGFYENGSRSHSSSWGENGSISGSKYGNWYIKDNSFSASAVERIENSWSRSSQGFWVWSKSGSRQERIGFSL
jgi:hypothetical protein